MVASSHMSEALLDVRHLTVAFRTELGRLRAVDDLSFALDPGTTLAVVGESGSGKSVTALSILRLIPSPPGEILKGTVEFEGQDLLRLSEPALRAVRGARISMIFQEPMTSLNPVYSVGEQISEALRIHQGSSRRQARVNGRVPTRTSCQVVCGNES
jgi:ABC-type microcin C transport system duplicated ATPase subunit YejF